MVFSLRKSAHKLFHRQDTRQAGVLVFAQMASQLLLLATLPLLSRLYKPESFGEHAAFLGLATLIASVLGLGYRTGIYLAGGAREVSATYQLCFWISAAMGLVVAGILAGIEATSLWTPFKTAPLPSMLMLAVSALLLGHQTSVDALHGRHGNYRAIGWGKFNITLIPGVCQILLALTPLQAIGLNLGRILGQVGVTAIAEGALPRRARLLPWRRPDWLGMRIVARRFADNIWQLPRILLARGGSALLPLVVAAGYGAAAAGLFFFADRVVARPAQLLSDAVSRIPLRNFAERIRQRKPLVRLALGYSVAAFAVGVPPFVLLLVFGERLFAVVFGPGWADAAHLAVILSAPAAVKLGTMPVGALIPALRIHTSSTLLELLFFPRIFLILVASVLGHGLLTAMLWLALATIIYDVVMFVWALRGGLRHDRALAAAPRLPPTA